jgi:hypothetical protein
MASLHNLAIGILRYLGWTNIAKALPHNARDAYRPLPILNISPSCNPTYPYRAGP